jgi:hypothetical protein
MAVPFGSQWGAWNEIPVGYQNELLDLKAQYEQLDGYQRDVSNDQLLNMANYHTQSLLDFGQKMASFGLVSRERQWLAYGLSQSQYQSTLNSYSTVWNQLTGQPLFVGAPGPDYRNAVWVDAAFKKGLSSSDFQNQLIQDSSMQQAYGWIKYGLNFQQFQQQKLSMQATFGATLTDAQGVQQLRYLHTAQGADVGARQQQTLTQIEKQAAQVGISGAQVR